MIQYYSSLAKHHGGRITGRYRNAVYFILDENHHYSSMDMSIATEQFILVAEPHAKRIDGFLDNYAHHSSVRSFKPLQRGRLVFPRSRSVLNY